MRLLIEDSAQGSSHSLLRGFWSSGCKDGLQTYLRPLLWRPVGLRAMMESAHRGATEEGLAE
jgi:hypothetical protein